MRFGIHAPYRLAPVEDGAYAQGFGRLVEDLGFESVWAVDHVVMCPEYASRYPYSKSGRSPFDADVVQPDPLIWLTWVAAATTRLRLATGILIAPQRNALVLAKQVASLDRLSGGRLLLGVGVGWVREESEALGLDFSTRGARCDEAIEALRSLWGEDPSSHHGRFVDFDRVVSRPKPWRDAGVPIIVGGHSPAAARRAGRLGDGFYPLGATGDDLEALLDVMRESAVAAGRDPARIEITCAGGLDPDSIAAYAEQGVARVVVPALSGELARLEESLGSFRDEVMSRYDTGGGASSDPSA